MPRNLFNAEMDQLLMDEIILSNPFKYGVTWDMILENLLKSGDAALFQGITKSYTVRGRALLIMGKRRALVAKQLSSSGLEEPPCTELDLALDEAIQLEDDSKVAQRMTQEDRKSDLMKVVEMQEARLEARQATLLESQARWRQVDSTAKMELANLQIKFRVKELELQRDRLDMEKKHREEEKKQREEEKKQREEEKKQREEEKKKQREEEKKQREEEMRLRGEEIRQRNEEMRQRGEENRIRSLESQNQRDALMKMLELLASKK